MLSDQPIATREFANRDGTVMMEIYAPQVVDEAGNHDCRWIIRWSNGKVKDRFATGTDSMQALLLAISMAHVTMRYPEVGKRDDSLTFLDHEELGIELIPDNPPTTA